MRAIFESKFPENINVNEAILVNSQMLYEGKQLYINFLERMNLIKMINEESYTSISDIYDIVGVAPFLSVSKRHSYNSYNSGIVVGAGSGNDCIDLIGNDSWKLFDLTDERMDNRAIGYCEGFGSFNKTGTRDGDTITNVAEKYNKGQEEIQFIKIDQLDFGENMCGPELISMDVEGSALDVLAGSVKTIYKYKPDLLVSIYHNWIEYLLVIPFLYDLGYNIKAVTTSNMLPHQPHLELSLFCEMKVTV